jgi:hypothetical protein
MMQMPQREFQSICQELQNKALLGPAAADKLESAFGLVEPGPPKKESPKARALRNEVSTAREANEVTTSREGNDIGKYCKDILSRGETRAEQVPKVPDKPREGVAGPRRTSKESPKAKAIRNLKAANAADEEFGAGPTPMVPSKPREGISAPRRSSKESLNAHAKKACLLFQDTEMLELAIQEAAQASCSKVATAHDNDGIEREAAEPAARTTPISPGPTPMVPGKPRDGAAPRRTSKEWTRNP